MTFQVLIQRYAHKTYLRWGDKSLSYTSFSHRVAACRERLQLTIQTGDIVILKNVPPQDFAPWLFALWSMQAIAFPLSNRLPHSMLVSIINKVKPAAMISPNADELSIHRIDAAIDPLAENNGVLPDFDWMSDTPSTMIMTSGSTGQPKYAIHSLRNHFYSALGVSGYFNLSVGESWLLDLPLYHVGGLAILMRCFLAGALVRIKSTDISNEIINNPPDFISLVGAQYIKLADDKRCRDALSTCRAVFLGGSAISYHMIQEALADGIKVYTSYALTEMSSTVAIRSGQAARTTILAYRELKIKDHEIWLRGPCLFAGYWQDGKVQLDVDPDGWFPSGDLGHIDDNGLHVTGRKDNMFISGGENIQPEEIEQVLRVLPSVSNALVFPLSDVRFGQRPGCFIKASPGQALTKSFLQDALIGLLPKFKIPVCFFEWQNSFDDPVQKISRPDLPKVSTSARQIS